MFENNIYLEDFANSFGTDVNDIIRNCSNLIKHIDFRYDIIDDDERGKLILSILKRIEEDTQIIGEPKRNITWNNGWQENLNEFIDSNHDINKLIPKFIRSGQPIRYNREYIRTSNPNFELDYYKVLRQWLFKKYLHQYNNIYEFGCGTGFNLVELAQLFPDNKNNNKNNNKKLYGLDFVPSSVKLINKIAEYHKYNMSGHLFDMISPNYEFHLEKNSAIFTIGAIEQLAGKFESFIEYILKQPVSLIMHVEPAIELYDQGDLIDYLAIKFQSKRGYTKGLLPYLTKLEDDGIIDILKVKRTYFGSLYMEGYNIIIWKPITKNIIYQERTNQ